MSKQQTALLRHIVICLIDLYILHVDNPKQKPPYHTCHHPPSSPLVLFLSTEEMKMQSCFSIFPPICFSVIPNDTSEQLHFFLPDSCVCVCCTLSFCILKESETCLCKTCMHEGKKWDKRNAKVTMFWKHHLKLSIIICMGN